MIVGEAGLFPRFIILRKHQVRFTVARLSVENGLRPSYSLHALAVLEHPPGNLQSERAIRGIAIEGVLDVA
jgi:hypothetical protein